MLLLIAVLLLTLVTVTTLTQPRAPGKINGPRVDRPPAPPREDDAPPPLPDDDADADNDAPAEASEDPRNVPGDANEGLVIQGAGRDETHLRLDGGPGRLDITWRDLTLDLRDQLAVSGGAPLPARVRFERCRVIGFDTGNWGSVAFRLDNCTFSGRDSEFLVGYGSSPRDGTLFRVKDRTLARLTNCRIRLLRGDVWGARKESHLCLAGCALVDLGSKLEKEIEALRENRLLPDTTVEYADDESAKAWKKSRPLSDLNPAWGKGYAR